MSLHPKDVGSHGAPPPGLSCATSADEKSDVADQTPLLEALDSAMALARDPASMQRAQRMVRDFMTFLDQALMAFEQPGRHSGGSAVSARRRGSPARPSLEGASAGGYADGRVKTGFSEREREIVTMISQGLSVGHIARVLDISPHTVRNHLKTCYRKIGVHTQIELVNHVLGQGLVTKT